MKATTATTRGEMLLLARRRRMESLRDVQQATGISISTVSRIENDKDCEWSALACLALHLHVDLNALALAESRTWEDATR